MVSLDMVKTTKAPPKDRSRSFTIGRAGFAKIGAVEGIKPDRERDETFAEFDRRGLSPEERRRALIRKYGK
jgi:hypothetical protein